MYDNKVVDCALQALLVARATARSACAAVADG